MAAQQGRLGERHPLRVLPLADGAAARAEALGGAREELVGLVRDL